MPDYGHPLRFGTFITPVNAPVTRAVDLAVLSEELGLDLVTFQDHPYNAGFHDTWTLMSYVASRTQRVHLAPNVLNLPLRPAAVTARAAASLDLLSGGRLALGLGAGAESRRPLGLAVVGGLLFSQLLTLFVTPVFYVIMEHFREWLDARRAPKGAHAHAGSAA